MEVKRIKRAFYTALTVLAIVLGISALALLGQTSQNSEQFGRLHDLLLAVNGAGVVALVLLIAGNLIGLLRDFRRRAPGAKLKARMLTAFIGLAVAPLLVVYLFAVKFLNEGIETWFDLEIEAGLGDALSISRAALEGQMRDSLQVTQRMATVANLADDDELVNLLGELREESGAHEVTLFGRNQQIVATSSKTPAGQIPALPGEDVALQLRQVGNYVGVDSAIDGGYEVRAAVVLKRARPGTGNLTLQAVFPVEERLGILVDSVENTYSRYSELVFLRDPLKASITITLTLVVMLSILAAVYGAFFFARRLVAPIQSLVAGTHAVAEGDFDTRLPMTSHDEIGFLIDSFNEMIERLAYAREEAHRNEQQVEKERAHLEAILARLSTGVIATEGNRRIRIANNAASAILHVDLTRHVGEPVMNLATDYPFLEEFMQAFQTNRQTEDADWRQQVILRTEAGRRVLVCASAELPMVDGKQGGHVVVFDDVTTLIQAQRDAAWGEVARRLAHEIKNPLTPIQLSAERIRRRYLPNMQDMEAEVLDRATHTIVQQVEAMRDMVNAFSEYARAPEISISHFDLNQLIREVAYLYRAQDNQPALQLELDEDLGEIEADAVRVRQLLHNLIRNAMEAMDGKEDALLEISTNRLHEAGKDFAEIKVRDNGPGIDTETLEELFDPYVTTKTKGTGLGLAIVKKLVEEHGGKVTAENVVNGGACITVCLPVKEATRDAMIEAHPKHPDYRRERA